METTIDMNQLKAEVIDELNRAGSSVVDSEYNGFKELSNILNKFDVKIFADEETTKEDLLDVLSKFYSAEEQMKYGVVGIKIEII